MPAFAVSLGANRALVPLAKRLGWCDRPGSGGLKVHSRPMPLGGGLGVLLGWAAALLVSALVPGVAGRPHWPWLAGGILALGVGMWDDFKWKAAAVPIPKLALQAGAAGAAGLLLWASGVTLVSQPVLGAALNAGFILGCMNAVNLEDGMDGLAAGEAAIAASGLAVVFLLLGRSGHATAALALAGALVGFLVLNWHPARVFLGDSGSHFVGAVLGMLALAAAAGGGLRALAGACLVVGLPVVDTAWVIARRLAAGRSLVAGDRSHLYDLVRRALDARNPGRPVGATPGLRCRSRRQETAPTGDGVSDLQRSARAALSWSDPWVAMPESPPGDGSYKGGASDSRRSARRASTRLTVFLAWLIQAALVGLGVFLLAGVRR